MEKLNDWKRIEKTVFKFKSGSRNAKKRPCLAKNMGVNSFRATFCVIKYSYRTATPKKLISIIGCYIVPFSAMSWDNLFDSIIPELQLC